MLQKMNLKYSIIAFIGLAIAILFSYQAYNYNRIQKVMEARTQAYTSSFMTHSKEIIHSRLKVIENTVVSISYNENIREFLTTNDPFTKIRLNGTVTNMISFIIENNPDIISFTLVTLSGQTYNYGNVSNEIVYYNRLMKEYKLLEETFTTPLFTDIYTFDNLAFYFHVSPIYCVQTNGTRERIGAIYIYCSPEKLGETVLYGDTNNISHVKIVDGNGTVFGTNSKSSQDATSYEHDGRDVLVLEDIISMTGWKIMSVIDRNAIIKDLNYSRENMVLTVVITVILLLMVGYAINYFVTNPIQRIAMELNNIGDKNIKQRLSTCRNNEIMHISTNINRMLDKIENMTREMISNQQNLYELELEKTQAELRELQSQINPHFLYNTLECIVGLGYVYNSKEIVNISMALSDILRYSIKGEEYVTVQRELDIIDQYMMIINIRFCNKFEIKLDIEEDVLCSMIPRMILQPVVENAVYHGMEQMERKGLLCLKGILENNTIKLIIMDNGNGISNDKLQKIRESLSSSQQEPTGSESKSIGLLNIHRKIQLEQGKEYGVTIQSSDSQGTSVIIRLKHIN